VNRNYTLSLSSLASFHVTQHENSHAVKYNMSKKLRSLNTSENNAHVHRVLLPASHHQALITGTLCFELLHVFNVSQGVLEVLLYLSHLLSCFQIARLRLDFVNELFQK